MSDCLYGKLNSETIKKEYSAEETETVSLSIDNVKNKISARVKKTPGILKITKSVNAGEQRTLVEFDGSESKEINLDEVDAYTGIENETSKTTVDTEHNTIDVEVKRTPGKIKFEKGGKILTDHLNREVEFDGSENTTLHIPETNYEGLSSDETATVTIDNVESTIDVQVNKVPNSLIITNLDAGTEDIFDGSKEIRVDLPEKGIRILEGTEENPIDLVNDTKVGEICSVKGVIDKTGLRRVTLTTPVLFMRTANGIGSMYGVYMKGRGASITPYYGQAFVSRVSLHSYGGGITESWGYVMPDVINGDFSPNVLSTHIYAPTESGIENQILKSNGAEQAPTWIDLPETGIPQLVGTEEKPINLATDLEVGQIYSVTGNIINSSSNFKLTNWCLIHKITDVKLITYGFGMYMGSLIKGNNITGLIWLKSATDTMFWTSEGRAYYGLSSVNGNRSGTVNELYAPTSGGTAGQILQSNGNSAPIWFTPDYASQSYVDTQIANLVDSAPETLNTLNELATAIQEHKDILDAIGELPTVTRLI